MATLNTRIQLRNDTAARWEQVNPVLYSGEFGFEKDTGLFKVGDGKSAWNSLPYANNIYSYNASQLTLDGHTLGLKGYGEKYYARKDDNTYELVDVDEEHPWKAGLTPRVVEEQGELTIGWFEESNSPAAIEGLKYEVVETLPEEPKDNVIYLVKDETVTAGDAYKEYLLIGEQLTQIGDTSVNLEGFVKDVNEDLFKIENGVLTSADKTLQAFDWEATRPFDKEYSVIGQTIYYDSAQFDDNGDVSNYLAEIDHTAKNFTVPNYPDGVRLLNKIHQDRVSGKYAKQVLVTRVRKPELVQDALIIGSTPTSVLVSRTNGKSAEHILIAYNTVEREFEISCYDHTSTASADAIKVRPYLPHEVFGEYYAYCPTDSWDLGQVKEACLGVESGKEVYLVFSENYTDLVDVEHKIVDYHGEHSTRGGDNADVMRVSFRAVSAKYIYDVSGYIVTAANGEILSQGSGLTIKRHKAYPSTIYVEADQPFNPDNPFDGGYRFAQAALDASEGDNVFISFTNTLTGETFKASITNLTTRVNSYEFSYKFELINEKGIYKVSGVCGFVRGYMEGSALDPLQFVPFGNGGSSDPYVLPVATDAILGGVKSNAAENGILVDAEGLMSVNTLNVNKLVGDLELDCGGAEVE